MSEAQNAREQPAVELVALQIELGVYDASLEHALGEQTARVVRGRRVACRVQCRPQNGLACRRRDEEVVVGVLQRGRESAALLDHKDAVVEALLADGATEELFIARVEIGVREEGRR
ncbi:hypothetical protein CAOG_009686 [Capsaspora owczarzaki ATCC 30864]|uniref:Uncharacterized protein n=1 Tax=Capsaspora owczarzaki (strain ATCC 30864) TaxID=595528 RepID=A0A0D2VQ22_CAPO3|nr:hypothetical protein CAOG_009686 [Capsaspora owczarzaki ATCC 30864]